MGDEEQITLDEAGNVIQTAAVSSREGRISIGNIARDFTRLEVVLPLPWVIAGALAFYWLGKKEKRGRENE